MTEGEGERYFCLFLLVKVQLVTVGVKEKKGLISYVLWVYI